VIFRFSEGDIFFDEVNRKGFLLFLKKKREGIYCFLLPSDAGNIAQGL